MITNLHSKVKDLSGKLETVETQKRQQIREVRKTLEQELQTLKERNQVLFQQMKELEAQHERAVKRVEESNHEI